MSDTSSQNTGLSGQYSLARQACITCRRQKRKCSRERPTCGLCRKNRRRCNYPPEALDGLSDYDESPVATEDSAATILTSAASPRIQQHQTTRDFPTNLFFLDSYIFKVTQAAITRRAVNLPPKAKAVLLLSPARVQKDVDIYFARFHPNFPIVAKMRLSQEAANLAGCPADTLFLLLAMRLVCRSLDGAAPGTVDRLYGLAKDSAALLDEAGAVSLRRLQACLLLAHHEIAYAIYPAAYMTVGTCARLGQMLGLHSGRDAVRLFPQRLSLVEHEESHRVWWATLVLDRYITIGLDDRPFACRDARPEELLPMDEDRWENGETSFRPALAVSADVSSGGLGPALAATPFARTCQAAHLLSRVLRHVNDTGPATPADYEAYYADAMQLHRVLRAFHSALWQEVEAADAADAAGGGGEVAPDTSSSLTAVGEGDSAPASGGTDTISITTSATTALLPFALCLSAQLTLYDAHSCADVDHPRSAGLPAQLAMQTAALAGARAAIGPALSLAQRVRDVVQEGQRSNGYTSFSPSVDEDAMHIEIGSSSGGSGALAPSSAAPVVVVSPLICNSLYQAGRILAWYYSENKRDDVLEMLTAIKASLADLGQLWPVANDYLSILGLDLFQPPS